MIIIIIIIVTVVMMEGEDGGGWFWNFELWGDCAVGEEGRNTAKKQKRRRIKWWVTRKKWKRWKGRGRRCSVATPSPMPASIPISPPTIASSPPPSSPIASHLPFGSPILLHLHLFPLPPMVGCYFVGWLLIIAPPPSIPFSFPILSDLCSLPPSLSARPADFLPSTCFPQVGKCLPLSQFLLSVGNYWLSITICACN